ncbi:hypothetical protein DU500_15550 [Haloplanus rubicundus]|jgi:hypothetical protein|uniref:Uncharacterized protein n=1 Tax=Haloplanus rubicundus TaxID=1547898 RepID=A0A345E6A6_9EURY|nr:hypothetical protein [Haloplanus rubicundus]AXG07728.1 hypothetical protein DU500_15550 [Haloplanus rubicundus]AXG11146.1 hypothetical protein DU484_15530 [Haloplanus rubicundus]
MTKRDLGWRPDGAADTYRGHEVWEYNIAPHEINEGETDGDIRAEDITGSSDSDSVIDADDL